MESFQVTQKNLNTETIDSLVLHSPCRTHADTMIVWRAFEELVKRNLVRGLGISNIYDIKELQKIYKESEVKPSVIQNRFYPDSEYDVAIRKFCKEKGIYYQSFWTLSGNPHFLKSPQVRTCAQ